MLEEAVRDAIVEGTTSDPILRILIEVSSAAIQDQLPIFPNPLHEPVLFRFFRGWVLAGLEEAAKLHAAMRPKSLPGD
jgi:hypothetical protein